MKNKSSGHCPVISFEQGAPTCLPELDRVAYLGSLLGVPSMLFLLVQSGRVGRFLCCCYRRYGRSPISPFRGEPMGSLGCFL